MSGAIQISLGLPPSSDFLSCALAFWVTAAFQESFLLEGGSGLPELGPFAQLFGQGFLRAQWQMGRTGPVIPFVQQ